MNRRSALRAVLHRLLLCFGAVAAVGLTARPARAYYSFFYSFSYSVQRGRRRLRRRRR